jgi:Ca2+-binding EF-hand superfamily protein
MGFSDSEHQKLIQIFKAFDTNGDGQLEYHEIYEGYKQYFNGDVLQAEKEAKHIFEKLDFNNNGTIDYSEFLITHLDPAKVINEDRLREVFDMFDSD